MITTNYSVFCNFFNNGFFGSYSTIKRARLAIEHYFKNDENVIAFEDIDNYSYQFTTTAGETFDIEIVWNIVDEEFVEDLIKEDE